jgi:hypothetical protein
MKLLCIYHKNCADGFAAAWVVHHFLGHEGVEFHAASYGDAPPDVTGRHVLLVDFSYKRPVLLAMAAQAKTILVIDHHKTAAEDLAGFPEPAAFYEWGNDHALPELADAEIPIAALFDMERSGAGVAWDFFTAEVAPTLIEHIQDRDLWRFKLEDTREIHAAIMSHPMTLPMWDLLMRADLGVLRTQGEAILRKHDKDVAEIVAATRRTMRIGGFLVAVANVPYFMASDAGHLLAEDWPFAATYFDTKDGRIFSLRSDANGLDVSEVAKLYGGGGHAHAAGFKAARGWEGDKTDA